MAENIYRTHVCSQVDKSLVSQTVKISGWVRKKRNHGTILFIDLVDASGVVQCIIQKDEVLFQKVELTPYESVVTIEGTVLLRDKGTINDKIASGDIEVHIQNFTILSRAQELPFAIHQEDLSEELQLKYRFLYLRRAHAQETLKLRTKVIDLLRKHMKELGFLEIQTPILASSSPEGARDFLVPSRLHKGKFFALPQAPQQFKQILMASGVEKYFQIAPCFRDEDSRADRTSEFYQMDFEMAYATQEDIFYVLEHVFYNVFKTVRPECEIPQKFPRIPYRTAIAEYGSDKPDLRNPLKITDLTNSFEIPNIFKELTEKGGKILALTAKIDNPTRSFFDDLQKFVIHKGGKGLAYSHFDGQKWTGPMSKMFSDEDKQKILENGQKISNQNGHNTIFVIADKKNLAYKIAGSLRNELGNQLGLIDEERYEFCLITDFPMFEMTDEGTWDFMHNPFSMPQNLDVPTEEVLSYQYDVVCNGYELSSGAVRNYDLNIVEKVFKIVGDNCENLEERFPVYKAFKYGIPPHAGSAPGIDRIIMLLNKKINGRELNLREVVAFPLTQNGENLLMSAPSVVLEEQLKELGIKVEIKE